MPEVTKTFRVDAAHRLQNHEGKCRNLHGHSYLFELTMGAADLDVDGMVVEFGVLKARFGQWLSDVFDHACLLEETDPLAATLRELGLKHTTIDRPPTAEHFAQLAFVKAEELFVGSRAAVVRVRVWETPESCCTVSKEET